MSKMRNAAFVFLALGFLLSACGLAAPPPAPASPLPQESAGTSSPKQTKTPAPASTRRPPQRRASATPTSSPTLTKTSTSTLTSTASPSPSPSATATARPSPTSTGQPTLFPMSIAAMRQGFYPGSNIMIDEELTAGANYNSYYVYYLSQGHKIYAQLTVPDGEMPEGGWPGIVFNHGYIPPGEYRTTERYVDYVDQLARSGYVIFRIDYRGHGNSEGTPQGAYGDPGYEVDVLNALAALKRYPLVNPQHIGMWGHSMGGYLTLRAMVVSRDVRAGVIWAGVVAPYPDLLYHWPEGPSIPPANSRKWMDDWPTLFGPPEENPAFWDSVSANSYLKDLSGPLQLHYGTGDQDVPPEFSETLAREVRAAGGDVEIYPYPGDNHNISNYFDLAMDRTIAFFDTVLK